MRQFYIAPALLCAATLAACGGDNEGDTGQPANPPYSQQVTFGDSLSDVGTYAVGAVWQLGGGKFTINGDHAASDPALTGKIWVEVLAGQLGVPAPCAAVTGLAGDAGLGFDAPVQQNANCYNYANGGARVTNAVGPGNAAAGSPLGALTIPVSAQVDNHLARSGGTFKPGEIVLVMAGGNDALSLLALLRGGAASVAGEAAGIEGEKVGTEVFASTLASSLGAGADDPAGATRLIAAAIAVEAARAGSSNDSIVKAAVTVAAAQPGNGVVASVRVYQPLVVKAREAAETAGVAAGKEAGAKAAAAYIEANAASVIAQMATAGTELAAIVNRRIIGNGAKRVVVNNLPDLANTPGVRLLDAPVRQLVDRMVDTFNAALESGIRASDKVLYVDIRALSRDHALNPARHGLTDTGNPACGPNLLDASSLVCTPANLVKGDVSRYMFADDVHPTPFEHALIARHVGERLAQKGWIDKERVTAAHAL